MRKEYKVLPIKFTPEEYKKVKGLAKGRPVSSYIKSLITTEGEDGKIEGEVWHNFEKKIEQLNTSLSVMINQKETQHPTSQGKSPALDLLKSFEDNYFKKLEKIHGLLSMMVKLDETRKFTIIMKEIPQLLKWEDEEN